MDAITRREALKIVGGAALVGSAIVGGMKPALHAAVQQPASTSPRRGFRLAHLTDVHVQPERRADQGMIACLHHLQNLEHKPQLIITGGDSIMDSFESDDARTQLQWNIWRKTLADECSIPVKSCIGNHDIWGINKRRAKTTGDEPNYGKQRAIDMLQLTQRYYDFELADSGWHCIVLDSTQPEGEGYRAYLDEPQLDWLQRTLASIPQATHIVIVSHIPIIAASAILWARQNQQRDYQISGSLIHQDAIAIKDLFAKHPNVRLCLSGHLHHVDRVDYNGVTYLCNGAVSGNWWKGRHKDCDEGYAIIDLHEDGTFAHQYLKYGWKAEG